MSESRDRTWLDMGFFLSGRKAVEWRSRKAALVNVGMTEIDESIIRPLAGAERQPW
jgi:hypothetical protein